MDWPWIKHLVELRDSGRLQEFIQESQLLLARSTDNNEKASLLTGAHVCCVMLGRLGVARQMLTQMQELEIPEIEVRLNAEFCEPCLLIQECKPEEGIAAFEQMLHRYGDVFREARFQYLYEGIQCRRALALFELSRFTDALPILKEIDTFSFEEETDDQRTHFALAVCYEETDVAESAKQEYFRVIGLNLKNDLEERARYRLSRLLYRSGALAQARKQLEIIVDTYPKTDAAVPPTYVYKQLSQVCRYLGDKKKARLYWDLAETAQQKKRAEEAGQPE